MDQLDDYLAHNDAALSRTVRTGKVAVSTDDKKQAPPISNAALVSKVSANRRRVADLLRTLSPRTPDEWFDFYAALIVVAHHALEGLNAPGLLRRWEYDPRKYNVITTESLVPFNAIPEELSRLAERTFSTLKNAPTNETAAVIAGLEWDLGIGPIHPFYDACGRISRYFSALVCIWSGRALPLHDSREEYMTAAQAGRDEFVEYWLAKPGKPAETMKDH